MSDSHIFFVVLTALATVACGGKPVYHAQAANTQAKPTVAAAAPSAASPALLESPRVNKADNEGMAEYSEDSHTTQPTRVAACIIAIEEGEHRFSNENPKLEGLILGTGPQEAQAECFAGENWPYVLPRPFKQGAAWTLPEEINWWRFKDNTGVVWVIGIAAPGIAGVNVRNKDPIAIDWPVSWSGLWGFGTAVLEIRNKVRITLALNVPGPLGITEVEDRLRMAPPCEARRSIVRLRVDDNHFELAPDETKTTGRMTITNEQSFFAPGECQQNEEGPCGIKGCTRSMRSWLVSMVERMDS